MRILRSITLASLFLSLLPAPLFAGAPDPYADLVYQASNQVYLPNASLDAPDQSYSQFLAKDASLTLDMGEGEEGTGDITMYFQILQVGAGFRMEFKDAELNTLQTSSAVFQTGVASVVIDYDAGDPYQYLKITSIENEVWNLDAVAAESYNQPEEEEIEEPTDEEAAEPEIEETAFDRGMLVKLPDDGDPKTSVDAAVYVIGEDGARHAFPTESVYKSWWENFDDVTSIDSASLAAYPLGKNVTVRSGTYLIKIVSDPRVYAVEPGSVLRWIASEDVAKELYGNDWADRVIDVSDAFFSNYTQGESVTSAVFPDGSVVLLPNGQLVYLSNATYYSVSADLSQSMRIQSSFTLQMSEDALDLYVDGGELEADADLRFPF